MIQMVFGFVLLLLLLKLSMRKVNGFDVLSVLLLAVASVQNMIGRIAPLLQAIVFCFAVAVLAKQSGANRKGMLFISIVLLFSEVLVQYKHFMLHDLEDIDPCTPIILGASVQAVILAMILYSFVGEDDDYGRKTTEGVEDELRAWLSAILMVSTVRSCVEAYECDKGKGKLTDMFNTLRILTIVAACVANGEDETISENDS